MLKDVASANFLSALSADVPIKAPSWTSSCPIDEKVGNFLALNWAYKSFLCSLVKLYRGVTKAESTSDAILASLSW